MTEQNQLPTSIAARAMIAGCVAVVLWAITTAVFWISARPPQDALGDIAAGVAVVFTAAAAVRGLSGLLRRRTENPAIVVLTDVAICVAGLAFIALVGSLTDSDGYVLYSVVVGSAFLLPAVLVVSVVIEIVIHQVWLIRISMCLASAVGVASLALFALTFGA
ncbi:hypothetical protein ACX3O0_06390 [Homoserinimonas sp. A447]